MLAIVCICLTVASSGCTSGGTTPAGTATPQGGKSATPAPAPTTTGGNVPDVSSIGENRVVKGNGDGEAKVSLMAGGYVAYVQARSAFLLQEITPEGTFDLYPEGLVPDKSGWLSILRAIHVNESGEKTFRIKTGGTYDLRFNRLPDLSSLQQLPATVMGMGTSCAGPVQISPGNVIVSYSCRDRLNGPITLYMVNGSGEYQGVIASSQDTPGTDSGFTVTRNFNITRSGVYYVQVDANSGTSWTVKLSR